MPAVTGAPTTHGIPRFADSDLPDLGQIDPGGGLGGLLASLDALIGLYKIRDVIVPAGGASSIDFANIPGTFAHLMLLVYGREDGAVAVDNVFARANGDVANNYTSQSLFGQNAAVTAAQNLARSSMIAGTLPGATAQASQPGASLAILPGYASAALFKTLITLSGMADSATAVNNLAAVTSSSWRNAAAINRLTLLPGTGNFITGTEATLYGLQ